MSNTGLETCNLAPLGVKAVGMELEGALSHLKTGPLLCWVGGDGAKVESVNLAGLKLRRQNN